MGKRDKTEGKEQPKLAPGLVSIYNKGARVFLTSKGKLAPGKSIAIPEVEAARLLKYGEVIETGKVPARESRTVAQLRSENEKLAADLEKAQADLAAKTPVEPQS